MDDIISAIDAFHQAATLKSGPSASRLAASRDWAAFSHQFKRSEALEAYAFSINLLTQVAGIEITISTRHEKIIDISDLIPPRPLLLSPLACRCELWSGSNEDVALSGLS